MTEDVATELLIVGSDGKLIVKSSLIDDQNPIRKQITDVWTKWIKDVETRKVVGPGGTDDLAPRPPGGS